MSDLAYLHEVYQAMQSGNRTFMQAAKIVPTYQN
jgi:hypothetical protein